MAINTEEIFKRMNIQQVRSFILDGLDTMEMYDCTYDKRLQKGDELMIKRLKKIYKDENDFSDAVDDFYYAQLVNSQVYTEIGMKAATRLIVQLLYEND